MSTSERELLEGKSQRVVWRVMAENSTGGFEDLSTLGDINWCESASWGESIDQPVASALIRLRRDAGASTGKSLAPLDTASTFNLNSTSGFGQLIWPGREVKIETATLALGSSPSSGDYKTMFWGEVDRVDWETSPIVLTARDRLGAHLADRWVEEPTKYGSVDGRAIQSVMQDISSQWTSTSLSTELSIYTPVSPGFLITVYEQQKMSVLEAQTQLADLIGWYYRPMWDSGSSAFRMTFAEPSRTASTADFTFGPDRYIDVRALAVDRTRVRNAVTVRYASTSGTRSSVSSTSTQSVADYGRRWMEIVEADGSAISSSSEAQTLADAVVEDLKDPEAEQEVETFFFWPAQLDDYYEFAPNGIHYTSTQFWGVYEIRHELSLDKHRTYLRVRGQPAAGNLRWQKRGTTEGTGNSTTVDPNAEPTLTSLTLAEFNSTNGKYTVASQVPGVNSVEWKLWERDSTGTAWPTHDGSSGGAFDDTYLRGVFPIDRGDAGLHTAASSAGTRYAIAVGVNSAGRVGPRKHASLAISTSTAGAGAGAIDVFYATPG
ncbi:MAG TPA: hypothetical protein VD948_04085, partial [Rhodothermales bacterium]|nr:hypothetical protein [Rhodothermales bacterium]